MSLCTERNQCLVCSFVSYNTNSNTDGVLSSIHTSYSPRGEGIDEIRGWRECVCACVQCSHSFKEPALDGVVYTVYTVCVCIAYIYTYRLYILYIWVNDVTLIFVLINKVIKKRNSYKMTLMHPSVHRPRPI